ncbi:MAG: hypothetical protein PHF51_02945 [Candidatus ainarchaeum sp.]|nr:hypothetical protein [Candidatus ainarchaeum sp.]
MKLIGLLSGGIDSAVAIRLLQKQGAEVLPVYFDNFSGAPAGAESGALARAKSVARALGFTEIVVVPHAETMAGFAEAGCDPHLSCVFCKRAMARVAERLAERFGAGALVTGDSLGQVASQTPENLAVETAAVKIPVLRPLIGLNKGETVALAREIGTMGPSTAEAPPCPFVPRKPSVKANPGRVEAEEGKAGFERLVSRAAGGARRLTI